MFEGGRKGLLFYLRAVQGRSTGTNKNSTRSLGAYVPRGTNDKGPKVFGDAFFRFDNRRMTRPLTTRAS